MLLDNKEILRYQYEVKANNKSLGKFPTIPLAESFIYSLSPELKQVVEIIQITSDGKQILLG